MTRTALRVALAGALAASIAPAAVLARKPVEDPLMPAVVRSVRDGKAVLVFFQAEWCEPCNELEARVLESPKPAAAALLQRVHVVRYDFDSDLGQAASRQLAVMSLPTTLVLRPVVAEGPSGTPLGYREIERVEGFEDAASWIAAVDAAVRRDPHATRALCTTWKEKRGPGHLELLACAATSLQSVRDGAAAAEWIEPRVTGEVPRAARPAARAAARALQRYWLRVRGDAGRCAEVAARTGQLAADDAEARAGFAYWHALCLKRSGQVARAVAVLEEHGRRAGTERKARDAARLLAADLLVHERIEPARARELLAAARRDEPGNDEAWYLSARLERDQRRFREARDLIRRARALAPQKALYRHFEEGLRAAEAAGRRTP
jgi:hypothetical protein